MGLDENVRQLYSELATRYEPGDRIFLFGFSRGAFTVRALAGLLYRCWLAPPGEERELKGRFDEAWKLFQPMERPKEVDEFRRKGQLECPIHFLGLWDTVKSYGIVNPVMLPHLRHNPKVGHIRHALAIHEHRAFFQQTTWGLLDLDEFGAMKRLRCLLNKSELALLKEQRANIKEVWFDGYHSDIGGGSGAESGKVTLRWMLGEAVNIADPVRLSDNGKGVLSTPDRPIPVSDLPESRKAFYVAAELLPRHEIDNSGEWPVKNLVQGPTGVRDLAKSRRGGKVFLHESVRSGIEMESERCKTLTTAGTAGLPRRG